MPVSTLDTIWSLASRPLAAPLLATAVLAGALGACSTQPDQFAPACPAISFLKDAADVTRFRPGGQDVTDMVLDGKLTAVQGACAKGPKSTVTATMKVVMELARGPAAPERNALVTFFVAATEGDRVLDEQDFRLRAGFASNIDRATFTSDDITMSFPVTKDKSAAAYHIYVGFRLTPDELAANRARGAR
jgi:hypothetical protein